MRYVISVRCSLYPYPMLPCPAPSGPNSRVTRGDAARQGGDTAGSDCAPSHHQHHHHHLGGQTPLRSSSTSSSQKQHPSVMVSVKAAALGRELLLNPLMKHPETSSALHRWAWPREHLCLGASGFCARGASVPAGCMRASVLGGRLRLGGLQCLQLGADLMKYSETPSGMPEDNVGHKSRTSVKYDHYEVCLGPAPL